MLATKIDPWDDELVYVQYLTDELPTLHRVDEEAFRADNKRHMLRTLCGLRVSFRPNTAMMPRKHAHKFAGDCPSCHRRSTP